MSELEVLNGDIVCLQEVGVDYYPFLVTEMKQRGYTGDFLPKTMGTLEGEATFYKHSMFEKIQVMSLQYLNLVLLHSFPLLSTLDCNSYCCTVLHDCDAGGGVQFQRHAAGGV